MPLTDFIDQLELIPLSGEDLIMMTTKLNNPGCRFMLYDDLAGVEKISQLFEEGNNTMFILLKIISKNGEGIGHWISIIKYSANMGFDYGHYDSYGLSIDGELSFTHAEPYLSKLLTGIRLEESRIQHQKFKDKRHDVNTCGRHVVSRSLFYYLTNAQYNRMIIQPILKDNDVRNPDVMVSLLTAFLPDDDRSVQEFFMSKVETRNLSF